MNLLEKYNLDLNNLTLSNDIIINKINNGIHIMHTKLDKKEAKLLFKKNKKLKKLHIKKNRSLKHNWNF